MATIENTGNENVRSKRDVLNERLKGKYPDKDFSDDEAFYGQISDDYDAYDQELDKYRADNEAFSKMLDTDPRSADFIVSMRNGGDPVVELIRRFGDEFREALDDPDKVDAIAEANKEFLERVRKSRELDEEWEKNIDATKSYLDDAIKEGKMAKEDADDAMEMLFTIVHDGIVGIYSPATIEMAIKALHHDVDVEDADRAGEVRGRNAKITEKLRKASEGDGTAQLDGQNKRGGAGRKMPHLGALDNYDDGNQTIWERGMEKRIKAPRD